MQPTKSSSPDAAAGGAAACFAAGIGLPSAAAFASAGGPREAGDAGLVSFTTTDTPKPQTLAASTLAGDSLLVNPHQQRSARCRKTLLNAARIFVKGHQAAKVRYKVIFVTLTYRPGVEWKPNHVSEFVKRTRGYLKRRGVDLLGLWKLEMQQRGAVHYHFMLWVPKGYTLPKPDKQGWWPHGSTKIEWLRNGYGYVAKYVGKEESLTIPKGARMYALLGMDQAGKREIRWWNAPQYVRERFPQEFDPVRNVGGGWVSRLTGEIVTSGYQFGGFQWVQGRRCVILKRADKVPDAVPDYPLMADVLKETQYEAARAEQALWETDRVAWWLKHGGKWNAISAD